MTTAPEAATVRLLTGDELPEAARLVGTTMLGTADPAVAQSWAGMWGGRVTHGAVEGDGRVVGVAQWFRSDVSVEGPPVPAACVTAVAVAADQRRRGHLRRLMAAELASIAEAEVPVALLVAAEWPIYGRYGYGPAIEACAYDLDAAAARFVAPPSGTIELVDPVGLQPHLEAVHEARRNWTLGAVARESYVFERIAGVVEWPGFKDDLGQRRGAIWRDDTGAVQGAVAYAVEEGWERNRPRGKATVHLLVGATPEAERELWRHLCDLDWVTTVHAGGRGVEDPLPHLLADARAAAQVDRFDCIWARVLDVPRVLGARRSAAPGRVVVDVHDDLGYAAGRWSLDLGPDGADVSTTTDVAEVHLTASELGALAFGGTSARRLQQAGGLAGSEPAAVARLDQLLRASPAPWAPTTF